MKKAAGAIAQGDYGFQVPVSGNDEIADTLRSFNEMSLQVRRYHEEQKKSRRNETEGRNRLLGILSTISEGGRTSQRVLSGGVRQSTRALVPRIS